MGSVLEFGINMSMLFSGDYNGKLTAAGASLDRLGRQIKQLQDTANKASGLEALRERITQNQSSMLSMRQSARLMSGQIQEAGQRTADLRGRYAGLQTQAQRMIQSGQKNTDTYRRLQGQLKALRVEIKQSEQAEKSLSSEQTKLYAQADKLQSGLDRDREALSRMRQELSASGVDTGKLSQEQARLQTQLERSKTAQDRLASAQSKYASIMSNLTWGNMKGAVLTAMGTYKAIEAPVKLSMDFEAAMARVKAVGFTDGTDMAGFERMKQQALELGAATKFTAVQAANAQENLIRGGMTPEAVIKAMPAVLNVAASEGLSIEQAGAIIAKGLGGMNLSAELASRYADVLAYTSSKSNTNIPMIAEAMSVAAPVAASQNIPLEKIAAYIGILANKGFEGSTAGNALASSFSRLAKMPPATEKALKELGVAVKTRNGELVELPEIMRQLSIKMKDMGEGDQLGRLGRIFGGNFDKPMIAFMAASAAGDVDRLQAGEFVESFGWSKKMADINQDTLAGQMDILQSSWDGLRTTIGDIFSPIVRSGVEMLSDLLSRLNQLVKDFPVIAKVVAEGLALIAGVKGLAGLYNVLKSLVLLPKAFIDMKLAENAANMATLAGNAETVAANMGNAGKAAGLFGVSLSSCLTTLGLIAVVCYEIYQHWEQITEWAQKAGEAIKAIDTGKIQSARMGMLSRSDIDYGVSVMSSTYAPPQIKNATGGIYTRPIWTWAAERGAEAIIPLTDKSRGIPLLMKSAQILGLTQNDMANANPLTHYDGATNTGGLYRYDTNTTQTRNFTPYQWTIAKINEIAQSYTAMMRGTTLTESHNVMSLSDYALTEDTRLIEQANVIGGNINVGRNYDVHSLRGGNNSNTTWPAVNLTVNITGNDAPDMSIAERIKQAVIDALSEISSREERLAYA